MLMKRVWAMPNADTFDVEPIGALVRRYLAESKVSVDPFARNKRWATYTNDLNPETQADSHMDAAEWLHMLVSQGVTADLVIFDPPYSPRQIQEVYQSIGKHMGMEGAQLSAAWSDCRDAIDQLLDERGVVLNFGWNSNGMGKKHGFQIEELLLVAHGACHNDTICTVERRVQPRLWAEGAQ